MSAQSDWSASDCRFFIAVGPALNFISYLIIKLLSEGGGKVGWLTYALAAVLLLYFVFVRSRIG